MISALVGIENVGMTFVSLAVIEKFGRTGLHVGGNVLMVVLYVPIKLQYFIFIQLLGYVLLLEIPDCC